jgi:hypothetical protein
VYTDSVWFVGSCPAAPSWGVHTCHVWDQHVCVRTPSTSTSSKSGMTPRRHMAGRPPGLPASLPVAERPSPYFAQPAPLFRDPMCGLTPCDSRLPPATTCAPVAHSRPHATSPSAPLRAASRSTARPVGRGCRLGLQCQPVAVAVPTHTPPAALWAMAQWYRVTGAAWLPKTAAPRPLWWLYVSLTHCPTSC